MKIFAAVRVLIAVLAIVGLGMGRIWAGTNVWTSHGPEGGFIRLVVVDPQNRDTVYARADFSGLFKSTDAGESWRDLGIFAYVVAIDPQNPSILYAAVWNRGILKSTDGGTNWTDINSGLQLGSRVSSLVIDPQNPNTVYAAFRFGIFGVFKTTDGGASWSATSSGLGGVNNPYDVEALAIDPQNPSTLYAAVQYRGIFKTTDGGASWSPVFPGFSQGRVFCLRGHRSAQPEHDLCAKSQWRLQKHRPRGKLGQFVQRAATQGRPYGVSVGATLRGLLSHR